MSDETIRKQQSRLKFPETLGFTCICKISNSRLCTEDGTCQMITYKTLKPSMQPAFMLTLLTIKRTLDSQNRAGNTGTNREVYRRLMAACQTTALTT